MRPGDEARLCNRVEGAVVIGGHERLAGRRKHGSFSSLHVPGLPMQPVFANVG